MPMTTTQTLAERSLVGAAAHAISVRAACSSSPVDEERLHQFGQLVPPREMMESMAVYAVALICWAHAGLASRVGLLVCAANLWRAQAMSMPGFAVRDYTSLIGAVTCAVDVDGRDRFSLISETISTVSDRDCERWVSYADAFVHAILLTGRARFGGPCTSAERMRNEMTRLAYICAA